MAVAERDLTQRPVGAMSLANSEDVSHGGMSGTDLEIPRALVLQGLSPDVQEGGLKSGLVINSLTKETLDDKFIALFPFKQYVKFTEEGKVDWKTINRNDPRVTEGLEWVGGEPPSVVEFINMLCLWKVGGEWDTSMPLILSFKKTSLRIGRQFNTLLALSQSQGKPYYSSVYRIKTFLKQDGQKSWYLPKISPVPTKEEKLTKEVLDAASAFCAQFKPLIKDLPAEVVDAEQDNGESVNQ
jgi:hypothetical protein